MPLPEWMPRQSGVCLRNAGTSWSWSELERNVEMMTAVLRAHGLECGCVGILADNSPHWIAADLAAHCANVSLVPLPDFFTQAQRLHAVTSTAMRALICADAGVARSLGFAIECATSGALRLFKRAIGTSVQTTARQGEPVQKITFTSGTTGAPKGVCLTATQQLQPARALAGALAHLDIERHLNVLPLPVLLENVAGVYTALLLGASCITPALADVGFAGSSRFDVERCLHAIELNEPHSMILLPQMLQGLVSNLEASNTSRARIRSLRFVAVGGARTPLALIRRARALGLPVYEGYGLSECASVVALNFPGADRIGTVGRALPGITVRTDVDGEIEVAGQRFAGYVGRSPEQESFWFKTGDLGMIDPEGYISIRGRKGNVLISSFGRNVSPEWPESVLLENAPIAQAAVFGEARPHLVAILVASSDTVADAVLAAAVVRANLELPDYARIGAWLRASTPFTAANGLATPNGRIRREALFARYAAAIDQVYATEGARL